MVVDVMNRRGEHKQIETVRQYSLAEAAEISGLCEGYLKNLRCQGKGPEFHKAGKLLWCWGNELAGWLGTLPPPEPDWRDLVPGYR